jgi:signal transduction histidine kinase
VLLCGWFALITLVAAVSYLLIGIIMQQFELYPFITIGSAFVAAATTLVLNRKGYYPAAKYMLLFSINMIVFLITSSESPANGAHPIFLVISIGAFGLFSYTEKIKPILFALFSLLLFLISVYTPISVLPYRDFAPEQILVNQMINFVVSGTAAVMVVTLLTGLNHYHLRLIQSQTEQLQKANNELDRFVYSTSHDLRAPLSSLMGLINITRNARPEEAKAYLNLMDDRIRSMDQFIKDITDYSRNNRQEIVCQVVPLRQLVEEVWETLRFIPGVERIELALTIPEGACVHSDPSRLKIILSNLLSNAIRYHDLGKSTPFIRLTAKVTPNTFCFTVEDNGQGIEPQYQRKIFDMFFRAHEKSKGSGLGLYIVKETIDKLAGSISVESIPGKGSSFTVRLPVLKAA